MSSLRPVTVITGASAGIGVALAHEFARHGHALALVARREDRLRALADEIAATGAPKPIVIVADLAQANAARLIGEALVTQGAEPQFVVNNAGYGMVGLAAARDRDEQLAMIDVNVRALTELSLAFVDSLERHRGGLLNVGSMAGFLPGPGRKPAIEPTLSRPPRWRSRLSTKASDSSVKARTLTSIIASCSSRSRALAKPTIPKPALLTMNCGSAPCVTSASPISRAASACARSATMTTVSYTHLRAHETGRNLVCRL